MSYFPGYQLKNWQFVSGVISLDGNDYGAEFARNPASGSGLVPIPTSLPDPLLIVEIHLTYLEAPGCVGNPLNPDSYGFMSINTDPGLYWHTNGGSPQNQSVIEAVGAFDLGRQTIRYRNPETHKQFKYHAPIVFNSGDGLVLDQVGYNGGHVRCIWDIVYLAPYQP
jgi:hypothetical protein